MTAMIALCLVLPAQVRAQERKPDTLAGQHIQLTEFGMDSGEALFVIPPHLLTTRSFSSPTFFLEGVPTVAGPGSPRPGFEMKQDLLAPLRVQWAREAQTSTFRSIMGSIQFAGVAYLAARQLTGAGIMTAKPRPVRSRSK
jgi:hypothetical protein